MLQNLYISTNAKVGGIYMVEFNDNMQNRLEGIRELPLKPDSHLYIRYPNKTIGEAASEESKSYGRNQKERPAIGLIEVVLSINRKYSTHVEPHIIRIEKTDLATFTQLEEMINTYSIEEFYDFWGHHDARKYGIMRYTLKAINILRDKYKIKDDYVLMNKWAVEANIGKNNEDIIGRTKFLGLATFQHLRMNYGVNTVKPDRQVKEVLRREFGFVGNNDKKAILTVENISSFSGYSMIELDQIFVNYGSGYYESESRRTNPSFVCKK